MRIPNCPSPQPWSSHLSSNSRKLVPLVIRCPQFSHPPPTALAREAALALEVAEALVQDAGQESVQGMEAALEADCTMSEEESPLRASSTPLTRSSPSRPAKPNIRGRL